MLTLKAQLDLQACPYCGINSPNIALNSTIKMSSKASQAERNWYVYSCARCGGLIAAVSDYNTSEITTIIPAVKKIDDDMPPNIASFLQDASNTLHTPRASIVMSAAAIDAMLKEKGLNTGSLYDRIESAAKTHLITDDMSKWAHDIRLDANDQRHAGTNAQLPTEKDAKKCLDFALTFGEILFVLPARVQRGIANATQT